MFTLPSVEPPRYRYLHPTFKTPWGGIFLHMTVCIFLVWNFDFKTLQSFDNVFNILPDLMQILAFYKLRYWGAAVVEGESELDDAGRLHSFCEL